MNHRCLLPSITRDDTRASVLVAPSNGVSCDKELFLVRFQLITGSALLSVAVMKNTLTWGGNYLSYTSESVLVRSQGRRSRQKLKHRPWKKDA